ncbi:MAG: LLM class F420-dependent oxidoreductase [Deltaproteobacteria bacterium]|jgi:probable F420-dependent oxidoreductase|nr:LLM class F420-dependent oxidoreductase [Deltaproteobacteria bacterium]
MQYGVTIFPTDYSMPMAELGPAVEERGFESLWVAEHSHIPVCRTSPWPGGGDLPKMYYGTLDPFVALTAAAVRTTTLKLGTGICLVVQRDPIHTAKQVASLDLVSGGRLLFGVGGGWNFEEMGNHGTESDHRFGLLRERIEAMKAIWSASKAEYHGKYVDFDPIHMWPKPKQTPHPPIHVGGAFPGGARRALRYGDGWIPIAGRDDFEQQLADFAALAAEEGRDPKSIEISTYGVVAKDKIVERYASAGIDRVVFGLPPADADKLLPYLDELVALIERVGG